MNAEDPFVRALTGDEGEQTITLVRRFRAPVADVWSALTDARPDRTLVRDDHRSRATHGRRRLRGRHRRRDGSARRARELRCAGRAGVHLVVRRRRSRARADPARGRRRRDPALRAARQAASAPDDPVRRRDGSRTSSRLAALLGAAAEPDARPGRSRRALGAAARAPAAARVRDRCSRLGRVGCVVQRRRARGVVVEPLGPT